MRLAVDASVLVAELLRKRGRAFFTDPRLGFVVAEEQWSELEHELERRLSRIVRQGHLQPAQAIVIEREFQILVNDKTIEVVPRHVYDHLEATARRRIPRDPNDWPTVALAIALGADILTNDHDFLGCGCATWTFETLRDELAHGDASL
jgi:predicted nucleic acid-binding protein